MKLKIIRHDNTIGHLRSFEAPDARLFRRIMFILGLLLVGSASMGLSFIVKGLELGTVKSWEIIGCAAVTIIGSAWPALASMDPTLNDDYVLTEEGFAFNPETVKDVKLEK